MQSLDPFYIYKITNSAGEQVHSSISYGEIDPAKPPSQAELRETLLVAASYASSDFEWPEHGRPDGKDLTITLFGPFFPGAAADEITEAEFHALDEDTLP